MWRIAMLFMASPGTMWRIAMLFMASHVADAVLLLDTQLREVLQRDLHLEMVLRKPACADLERAAVVESCR
jgi:hypothetical protein